MIHAHVPSPLGPIHLVSRDGARLAGLYFPDHRHEKPPGAGWAVDPALPVFVAAARQLDAYFAGRLRAFDLPLDLAGTAFQRAVWDLLLAIPHGATRTYGALAAELGQPSATRAVGAANGRNPVSVIVPCHRLIAAGGGLVAYGGGLDRKRALLDLEQGG